MDNAFLFPTYPLYVMLKPVGASCNMACRYCYYLEKSKLYPQAGRHAMSESLLRRFIQQYIGAQTNREVLFTWHGGEAMMLPLSFYEKALEMQRQYAGGMGKLPLHHFRRMGQKRCRRVVCPAFRRYTGQLVRSHSRRLLYGWELWSCRCYGMER